MLANTILVVHFAWIFYVIIGQLLIFLGIAFKWDWIRNFWFRFTHLSMMALVAVEALFKITCPLTLWESSHRDIPLSETEDFIVAWMRSIIFFDLPSDAWQFLAGYLGFTLLVIWSYWIAPPRRPMSRASFIALVHLFIGAILLATAYDQKFAIEVGAMFLVQAAMWYGLQERSPLAAPSPPGAPRGEGWGEDGQNRSPNVMISAGPSPSPPSHLPPEHRG